MDANSKLIAWTVPHREGVVAAFVSSGAKNREPATRVCVDQKHGWQWVETQAASFGVEVEWVAKPQ